MLKRISDAYVTPPDGFTVHPKVMPQLQRRAAAITDGPIDWGTGEIIAFGSLLMEGRPVRLAGQDSRRGTFVSRFATIIDRTNADEWTPLSSLTEDQARFYVYDSLLSEYAALGFEYGYSVARPDALVIWEAQFGDFVNGAQIVIDEFITAGETKWRQQSGVVMLLPHGYEGQGPDHSSARIERFLTMAAEDAFVVAQPSTPASYFHLLRQHSLGEDHRPLVVFTPKSMLKRKEAASQPEDFTTGEFRSLITDADADPEKVETLLLCSGRVTWDLKVDRAKREDGDKFAIARIEQLYPRPVEEIHEYIESFPNLKAVRWVQDEPRNMGPWPHYALNVWPALGRPSTRSPGLPPPRRRSARRSGTSRSRRPCSTGPSPPRATSPAATTTDPDVLHRPRDRGARQATGGRGGHPGLGRRAASGVHRPPPRVRDRHRAAGHVAGEAGRPRRLRFSRRLATACRRLAGTAPGEATVTP